MKNLFHFLKYHNAVSITAVFLIVASGSLAASPDLRNGIEDALLAKSETIVSVNNTRLLNIDLDHFDTALQIKAIAEDDGSYYVTYGYKTLAIEDSVWLEVTKEDTLEASKALLTMKGRDLGLYVAEELGEVAAYQLAYLKEVQTKERERGESRKVASIAYAGLIGKFLEPTEKTFPGYEPVVPAAPEPTSPPQTSQAAVSSSPEDQRALIKEMVAAALADLLPTIQSAAQSTPAAPVASESQPKPVAPAPPADIETPPPAASLEPTPADKHAAAASSTPPDDPVDSSIAETVPAIPAATTTASTAQ